MLGFKVELKSCSNASVGLISVKIVVCLSVCFLTKTSYWFSPFEVDKRLGSHTAMATVC